jgi:ribonuclease Z
MDLSTIFLGTGGSVPTSRRATACLLVRHGGDRLLFDAGEGAQRQMVRSIGLIQIDEVYLTHFHADHYLGLPGLLRTYSLTGREKPLRVLGPPGLGDLVRAMRPIVGRTPFELELIELGAGEPVPHDGYEVRPFAVEHRMEAYGYALVEQERPGRFDEEAARGLGVADVRDFGRLQRGETVEGTNGPVRPDQVLGEPRRGRKIVITGDTQPSAMTRIAAHEAELLVHDGTFSSDEADRAAETGHSTAAEAAELAHEAEVRLLALVHVSSRYNVAAVLEEARAIFPATEAPRDFDLVEIPFPERGEPELVREGALREPEATTEPVPRLQ